MSELIYGQLSVKITCFYVIPREVMLGVPDKKPKKKPGRKPKKKGRKKKKKVSSDEEEEDEETEEDAAAGDEEEKEKEKEKEKKLSLAARMPPEKPSTDVSCTVDVFSMQDGTI